MTGDDANELVGLANRIGHERAGVAFEVVFLTRLERDASRSIVPFSEQNLFFRGGGATHF